MQIQRLFLVLSLAALGACTTKESSTPAPTPAPAPAPAETAKTSMPSGTLLAPEDAAIPTEAEAADAAAKAIDGTNADAELEKLKQEIQGGH